MNPFATARQVGHSVNDILKFAANSIPGMEDKIKYALAMGYSADEVMKFLSNAFQSNGDFKRYAKKQAQDPTAFGKRVSRKGTETEKQLMAQIRNRRLSSYLQPENLAAGAIGAGVGGAIGGPMGAVAGAVGASQSSEDLMRKYEEHLAQGGQLSLSDFLKSIIKGAGAGAASMAMVEGAKALLAQLSQKEQEGEIAPQEAQEQPTGTTDEEVAEEMIREAPPATEAEAAPMPIEAVGGEESLEWFQDRGLDNLLSMVMEKESPQIVKQLFRNMKGAGFIKSAESDLKKPFEQIVKEAYEQKKRQGEAQVPTQDVPQITESSTEVQEGEIAPQEAQEQPTGTTDEEVAEEMIREAPPATEAEAAPMPIEAVGGEESLEWFQDRGLDNLLSMVMEKESPQIVKQLFRNMKGAGFIKSAESDLKKPFEQIVKEAYEQKKRQGEAQVPTQDVPQITESSTEVQEEPVPGEPISQVEIQAKVSQDPIEAAYDRIFTPPEDPKKLGRNVQPLRIAMKSSNIAGATYDSDTQKLRVIFAPKEKRKGGTVYEYENVDQETWKDMAAGNATPVTEGSSKFGIWFHGKDPSVGAAFAKKIRKNKEKFPYDKKPKNAWTAEENQLIESNRSFLASDIFEPFAKKRKRTRSKQKGRALSMRQESLREADDEFLADLVEFLEGESKRKDNTVTQLEKDYIKGFL